MMQTDFQFLINQKILIGQDIYMVTGAIDFYNRLDNSSWTEYQLLDTKTEQVKWLSIDTLYEEYALFTSYSEGEFEFQENTLLQMGYHDADSGKAIITNHWGHIDVTNGDMISYIEYEDNFEKQIINIKHWKHQTVYSSGFYLNANEIQSIESSRLSTKISNSFFRHFYNFFSNHSKQKILLLISLLFFLFIAFTIIMNTKESPNIQKYIAADDNFTYVTSILSETDSNIQTNIYTTTLTIDYTLQKILDYLKGLTNSIEVHDLDNSITILTPNECCLIYKENEDDTFVQISPRMDIMQSAALCFGIFSSTHFYL